MGNCIGFPSRCPLVPVDDCTIHVFDSILQTDGIEYGKGVIINSSRINDAPMITLGDGVVVGGDATINGHLVEMNELVLAPVCIGRGSLIGGGSVIQPGCKMEQM